MTGWPESLSKPRTRKGTNLAAGSSAARSEEPEIQIQTQLKNVQLPIPLRATLCLWQ